MPSDLIYLDHNATTPIDPRVVEAMAAAWMDIGANPASQHAAGRKARRVLEECREGILTLLGGGTSGMEEDRLIFTSGGTEANNLVLSVERISIRSGIGPGLSGNGMNSVLLSAIEHPSIVGAADELARRGTPVIKLPVTREGVVNLHAAQSAIRNPQSAISLVSVMLANNETGVLQPVRELAAICQAHNIPIHTDAVQAVGKISVSFHELGVDAMTVSPHKFHGPLGIGALIVKHGLKLQPLLFGGFQQAALRPGTECVALAVGFFTALKLFHDEAAERQQRMTALREQLEQLLLQGAPDAIIIGAAAPRLPTTTNIAFPGINRQALVMALDLAGVACSTGSACASGSSEPSPVLLAMSLEKSLVEGSIRLSLGAFTTVSEVEQAARRILKCVNNLRARK
ncbi:MAG TPA: cysteine desulfurase family protein [Pirellulaceae bacterium]|nr:cysteine desulfurase family protein [Pirellulaceae bacterium]